jgi:hypothetical protein
MEEYKIELPDGTMIDPKDHIQDRSCGYKVYWNEAGVYAHLCHSGGGYGKLLSDNDPPVLLVKREDYDEIELVGEPLVMSDPLIKGIINHGHSHTLPEKVLEGYNSRKGKIVPIEVTIEDIECIIRLSKRSKAKLLENNNTLWRLEDNAKLSKVQLIYQLAFRLTPPEPDPYYAKYKTKKR